MPEYTRVLHKMMPSHLDGILLSDAARESSSTPTMSLALADQFVESVGVRYPKAAAPAHNSKLTDSSITFHSNTCNAKCFTLQSHIITIV